VAYSRIAKTLGVSYNSVQHICREGVKPARRLSAKDRLRAKKKQERTLNEEHVNFLTGARTLEVCAGFTLKERARFFHRKFLNKTIAVTSLRKLYLKHGIKRKKVRQEKSSEYRSRADYKYKCRTLSQELDEVRRERRRIIFLDEINFTKLSLPSREWSKKH
jgi:hypothetical protein